ncbi:SRPBCC family protein [Dactylosporangium sp. NPDC000521]|uniref:SRPBCC family protein n=1 Tax=Dactylosporangium sp. NPDC000521 TaxID=3363975 RepID=UPI00369B9FCC
MTSDARSASSSGIGDRLSKLLVQELQNFAGALGRRALTAVQDRVEGKIGDLTGRLNEYAERSGSPKLVAAAKGAEELAGGSSPMKAATKGGLAGGWSKIKKWFGGGRSATRKLKVTNIVEWADVGVPLKVAYNQWTSFDEFPKFMKKVEKVDREAEEKLRWRAQIFWSHRDWESDIVLQVPDERIVWRSKGAKGYVNGAVSFHAVTPTLTRIVLILEYYPKGLFERTGNLWRAQGRRARLEFKHYVRHTMTQSILNPDEIEGWRGVIRDGQVELDHETAMQQEREREEQEQQGQQPEDTGEQGERAAEEGEPEEGEGEEGEPEEGEGEEGEGEEGEGEEGEGEEGEGEREAERDEGEGDEGERDEDEGEAPPARRRQPATPRRAGTETRDRRGPDPGDRRKRSTTRG